MFFLNFDPLDSALRTCAFKTGTAFFNNFTKIETVINLKESGPFNILIENSIGIYGPHICDIG